MERLTSDIRRSLLDGAKFSDHRPTLQPINGSAPCIAERPQAWPRKIASKRKRKLRPFKKKIFKKNAVKLKCRRMVSWRRRGGYAETSAWLRDWLSERTSDGNSAAAGTTDRYDLNQGCCREKDLLSFISGRCLRSRQEGKGHKHLFCFISNGVSLPRR